jgi:hypothetical protein
MTFNKLFFLLNTLLNDIQQPVYFFIILLCVLGVVLQTILDIYICMCLCLYVCLWHVSMRIFNLFMIPLPKIRLREFVTDINNQLAWKCIKKTCHTVFGIDVAGRLVDNAFYVKLTEDQVRISLKRTFMYFRDFSFSALFLKVQKKSHSMVRWLCFIIENIKIHHCICLLLILPY